MALLGLWILFTAKGWAQNRQAYTVPDFTGGINVATDSTNLKPNEALEIVNLTLDMPNVLTGRFGFTYWDTVAIDTSKEIDAIYVYEPYAGTQRMIIASGGYIYVGPSLTDTVTNWSNQRLGYSGDSLAVTLSSGAQYDLIDTMWHYMRHTGSGWKAGVNYSDSAGDWLEVTGDTSGSTYVMGKVSFQVDTNLTTMTDYLGASDTTGYNIYKRMVGKPHFTEWNGKLYISDSAGFPIVYNDTSYMFTAVVDTGLIGDTLSFDSAFVYSKGKAIMGSLNKYVWGSDSAVWTDANGIAAGRVIVVYPEEGETFLIRKHGSSQVFFHADQWASPIDSVDTFLTGQYFVRTQDPAPHNVERGERYNYKIATMNYACAADTGQAIVDASKHWLDFQFGENLFTGLFSVTSFEGTKTWQTIYCNSDSTYSVDGLNGIKGNSRPDTTGRYYIFSRVPYKFHPADIDDWGAVFPFYEQIHFLNAQLYGFGYEKDSVSATIVGAVGEDRIWFSEISYPEHISPFNSFNVGGEDISVLFDLRGDLFIGTDVGIWRSSGIAGEDNYLSKIVSSQGIPDLDNWAKATEEYGYFTNITGIYRFDGVRPQKVSWRVDPIIKNNYASRIVMGYQDFRLYISFPDSNFTLIYDERFDPPAFYKFDFGMTCFYAPPDTNIFYFGHSLFKGRVYYYPSDGYNDNIGYATGNYTAVYESGWQDLGGYWNNKRLHDIYFPVSTPGSATFRVYTDFSTTQADSFYTGQTGRYVYRPFFNNDCVGEYFKVRMEASAGSSLIFGGYRIEWNSLPDLRK